MPDILPLLPAEAQALADSAKVLKTNWDGKVQTFLSMPVDDLLQTLLKGALEVLLKILIALAIYLVGRWFIRYLLKVQKRIMDRRDTDPSLRVFLNNLTKVVLIIMLLSIIIGVLGLDTTSLVAIFASAGLAVGMALSGTLQNFAGGVMILALRPFRVGEYIEVSDQSGTVKEIRLFHTLLNTSDNKTIILPNGSISNSIINNYSREPLRRVEWIIKIGYGEDYDHVKSVINGLLNADKRVLRNPEPLVALHYLDNSSVNIVVRAWAASGDFWDLYFSFNEQVYKRFGQLGINIPLPQMDVNISDKTRTPQE